LPTYCLKKGDRAAAQARLDATLFAEQIAPPLNIVSRYAGEEPLCQLTRAYNEALLDILPKHGLEVRVMPRVCAGGEAISASRLRRAWRAKDWAAAAALAPEHTLAYLQNREP
jgi:[citrate (pro-3S)-lyase] ligase